jgi:hypothetical protein
VAAFETVSNWVSARSSLPFEDTEAEMAPDTEHPSDTARECESENLVEISQSLDWRRQNDNEAHSDLENSRDINRFEVAPSESDSCSPTE